MQTRTLLAELLAALQRLGALGRCLPQLSENAIATLLECDWWLPAEVGHAVRLEAERRERAGSAGARLVQ